MYTITLGLHTKKHHIDLYDKKLDIARKMYNILVKQCIKRLAALRQDRKYLKALKQYRALKESSKDTSIEIKKVISILNSRIEHFKLRKSDLESFLDNDKNIYKKNLGSTSRQKIALRVYSSLEKMLYSNGKMMHFKKFGNILSIEGKSNKTDIRLINGYFQYGKHKPVKLAIKKQDLFIQETLDNINQNKSAVAFCRLLKKYIKGKVKYYLQVIVKGELPPKRKVDGSFRSKISTTEGRVGIDPGVSTMSIVSEKKAILAELAENINSYNINIARLSQKLERSRRLSNPSNYNEDGTIKKSTRNNKLEWIKTKNYIRLLYKLKDAYRKKSLYVRESHNRLANEVSRLGNEFYIENMNYSALAKKSSKSTELNKKTGKCKRKKRFGKSILDRSPSLFITLLENKLNRQGIKLKYINTRTFRASQYNHLTDTYSKKPLSQRYNNLEELIIQRDLYSAFLIMNSNRTLKNVDRNRCKSSYEQFIMNHNNCINELIEENKKRPKSFGLDKFRNTAIAV